MRNLTRALTVTLALFSTVASATKIPLGPDGQSLTVNFQLQTWASMVEKGAPNGEDVGYDMRLRRARLVVAADPTDKWSFLLQLDWPNLGMAGNYSPGLLVQDAWGSYAFTGRTGGTAVMIDAGFLLLPMSRQLLSSTTSFTTVDVHTDAVRGFRDAPGLRDLGVSLRGWLLDKKIGFRGGIYRGTVGTRGEYSASNTRGGLNPRSSPRLSALVNVNLLGTEEGGWLYQGIYFTDKPIVSMGGAVTYQSRATRGPRGVTDSRVLSAFTFADIPTLPDHEAIFHATAYRNDFGGGSRDTGWGYFVDAGYRIGFVQPYVSYEGFAADACPADLPTTACGAGTANSSIFKAGAAFYINKNANHIRVEYASGRSLKPDTEEPTRSLLAQWNFVF